MGEETVEYILDHGQPVTSDNHHCLNNVYLSTMRAILPRHTMQFFRGRMYVKYPMIARQQRLCMRRFSWPYGLIIFFVLALLVKCISCLIYSYGITFHIDCRSWLEPDVLRPGQYHDAVAHDPDARVQIASTPELPDQDDMGHIHDISWHWSRTWKGQFRPCQGPRGRDLDRTNAEDMVHVYRGKQQNFPSPAFGSYETMHLDGAVCTDRYSRFGIYGHDAGSIKPVDGFKRPPTLPWDRVDWGTLQASCYQRNSIRYRPSKKAEKASYTQHPFSVLEPDTAEPKQSESPPQPQQSARKYHSRSAVLVRTWHTMPWTENHREYLRSLIMELSLHSGAEYEVFLMVHVKDNLLPIFSDVESIHMMKRMFIPPEFWNITVLFNDKLLEAWYPRISEHRPMYQHLQPLQIFAQSHPEFDYYWQLEMDARFTGHVYHFLESAVSFARHQPRKYLWERNSYFYTPSIHGTWASFAGLVEESMQGRPSVWGPVPAADTGIQPVGPAPPVPSPNDDAYTWGVDEEADLITFLPIFNPQDTTWTFPNVIWNFPQGTRTPRRAGVITMGRFSNRLLTVIHRAQAAKGLGVVSEMTGPTAALHHGLKAVYVPHPIYADGIWSGEELGRIFNTGPPEKINGGPDSVWNWNHRWDHIIYRLTYMFTTYTAEDLFRWWMGYRTDDGRGGKEFESVYGRPCFPSMFLHTIKNSGPDKGPERPVPLGALRG
ncbi:hypothetical protein ASPZODRAFT_164659 [Penicilliopsis zonata CBS 506.65]|uniref:Uncharacterized protein n=1 Tax=Penicilliopsis zonata CBS 506.65 TaxID=1073090 RepID=A0A1L9SPC6_9EURO|nr:hypothetical protein ASPZODRAFT_164659 [Penicilliopsis zonata CBS 506.65]OJJ49085.1 hypothetical protein ASPZODRAFT_164659 [Penicilliopsis zonata CBS 506.65]